MKDETPFEAAQRRAIKRINRQYAPNPTFTWIGMVVVFMLGFAIGAWAF